MLFSRVRMRASKWRLDLWRANSSRSRQSLSIKKISRVNSNQTRKKETQHDTKAPAGRKSHQKKPSKWTISGGPSVDACDFSVRCICYQRNLTLSIESWPQAFKTCLHRVICSSIRIWLNDISDRINTRRVTHSTRKLFQYLTLTTTCITFVNLWS